MKPTTTMQKATDRVRDKQTPLALRKESLSALAALLVWVATLVAEHVETIPDTAGTWGQALGIAASALAVGIARYTKPALTPGQQRELIEEAERLDALEAARAAEDAPAELPIYDGGTDYAY